MGLETGTTIESLDDNWPLGGDGKSQGDNHIRLLKAILKATFPGEGGDGFNQPITATEDQLNALGNVTGDIQGQIDAIIADDSLIAPSGTVMIFFQETPPTGWTQLAANNDSMLRVVDADGGTAGGNDTPVYFSTAHTHIVQDFTISVAQLPPHNHVHNIRIRSDNNDTSGGGSQGITDTGEATENTGGGDPITGVPTLESANFFRPRYINTITATKD